jgi:Tfp pilus assembly protein PilO
MANEQTDGERLAALEAILQRVESKLDKMVDNYPTRHEIDEMFRSRDEKIARLEEGERAKRNNWPQWISAIVAGIALLYSWYHGGK